MSLITIGVPQWHWPSYSVIDGFIGRENALLTFIPIFLCIFALVKIEEAIQRFADHVTVERRLAAGTVKYYVGGVEDFAQFLATRNITDVDQIDPRHVREWQMELISSGHIPSTVTKLLTALRVWFRYLRLKHYMDRDIMARITPPKSEKHLPVFFRQQEVEHIYDDIYPDSFDGQRDKLLLRMLYETGMRRSELATLPVENIDTRSLTIKVRGKRNKERVIPIENELAHNITRYLALREQVIAEQREQNPEYEEPCTLLVNSNGKAVNDAKIYRIVEHYMAILSNAERTSPHIFRHTFATHMLDEGANIDAIKDLLGHSSLDSTEVYTHVTRQHLKESYKHAHPRALKQ